MNDSQDNALIINNLSVRKRLGFPIAKTRPVRKLHVTAPDANPDTPSAPRLRSIFNLEA